MLDFVCQRCGTTYHAEESHAGKMIRCRQCGELVSVVAPARPVTKCGHCGKPMDAPEGHARCGAPARQVGSSKLRSLRWFAAGGRRYSRRNLVFLLAVVVVIIGVVMNVSGVFQRTDIGSRTTGGSTGNSTAQSPAPAADAANTACSVENSMVSSSLSNGTEIRNRRRLNGRGKLEVENGNSMDAVVNLVDVDAKRIVRSFYIKANNKFTEPDIAPGLYHVQFVIGNDRDTKARRFARCAEYQQFPDNLEYSEPEDESTGKVAITTYQITLHDVFDGNVHIIPMNGQAFDAMMVQSE
jgi:DNA-directed RNA polymerase subunit RPC12/RpoP